MDSTLRPTPSRGSSRWPDEPMENPQQEVARRLALNLTAAIGDRSIRSVALDAGLDPRTVSRVIAGTIWCDILTLAKLEEYLDVALWPGRLQ